MQAKTIVVFSPADAVWSISEVSNSSTDRQPTGGYHKIATIISSDLGRFAQARPGALIRFRHVDHAGAVAARAEQAAFLDRGPQIEPLIRTRFTSEFLLSLNLVDGCLDALRPDPA